MKVVLPKNQNNKSFAPPPIPFEKKERKLEKGEHTTVKLRVTGADPQSATREITMPHFKDGTPEELLTFFKLFNEIVEGQNLTTGPQKYSAMRNLLQGSALSVFNHQAAALGDETNANFEILKKFLVSHVFPRRALRLQKRFMRRHLRKPRSMNIRNTYTRAVELNDYLSLFPNGRLDDNGIPLGFSADQKLGADELADILEFGCPHTWQKKMVSHGFDPIEQDDPIASLVEFCERIETVEGMEEQLNPNKKSRTSKTGESSKRQSDKTNTSSTSKCDPTKFCKWHGQGHDTDGCDKLDELIKEKKAQKQHQSADSEQRKKHANKFRDDAKKQLKALVESQRQMMATLNEITGSARKRQNLTATQEQDVPSDEEEDEKSVSSGTCAAFTQSFANLSVDSDGEDLYA